MSYFSPHHWYNNPITDHSLLSDAQFESLFEQGDLPPSLFDHEAHLRLAWLYIRKYGEKRAVDKTCVEIRQFDKLHGKGDKFNTTVTIAAVKTVKHFMQKSDSEDFYGFIKEFPRLKYAFKALLDQHYGVDIFSSESARASYLEPDILPFE
ncbi:hypothetical protein [Flagellimonas sp. S3867]|uniref:hypothetical protein n=1 Tax=Flagellimonas sp. S3867 TaxID=2768063 RepID=UPI001CC2532E|nr:hypothetical protein [Flagellimonas sp. S3867]